MKRRPVAVLDKEHLADVVKAYLAFDEFVFDVETKASTEGGAVNPLINEVTWIALAGPGRTDAIPVAHEHGEIDVPSHKETYEILDPAGGVYKSGPRKGQPRMLKRQRTVPATYKPVPDQLTPGYVFDQLEPLFFSERRKIGHNVKFDLATVAKYYDWHEIPPPYGDTILVHHLLNENQGSFRLGDLCKRIFNLTYPKIGKLGPHLFPFSEAAVYAMRDAKYTWLLWDRYVHQLREQRLWGLFRMEMDLLGCLVRMEREGVPIDQAALDDLREELMTQRTEIEKRVWADAGRVFNLNANAEKGWYIYKHRGYEPVAFTQKTGQPSTRAKDLEKYAEKDPLVADMLDWSSVDKMLGTYVDGMAPRLAVDGRLHADFLSYGTVTGRFSCREPNLQNIPRTSDDPKNRGRLIRSLFVAPEGHSFVAADYDQIELRVLAHFSRDPILVNVFEDGLDPHATVIAEILGKDVEDVSPEERQVGKTTNFLIMYGGGSQRLAGATGIGIRKAERYMDRYWERFAGVRKYNAQLIRQARKHRIPQVRTIMGRVRRLPMMRSPNDYDRYRAERQALNSVIQGSAADIIKIAMIRYDRLTEGLPHKLVLTVHDELITISPDDRLEEGKELLEEAMMGETLLNVPLTAEASVAKRWSEAKG